MGSGFLDLAKCAATSKLPSQGRCCSGSIRSQASHRTRRRAAAAGSRFDRARRATPGGARPRSSQDHRRGIRGGRLAAAASTTRRDRAIKASTAANSESRPGGRPSPSSPIGPWSKPSPSESSPWAPSLIASDCAVRPLPASGSVSPTASLCNAARPAPDNAQSEGSAAMRRRARSTAWARIKAWVAHARPCWRRAARGLRGARVRPRATRRRSLP